MRIAEKTAEINFCAGLSRTSGFQIFWFGLTQKQEARAGFDVCTRVDGHLVLFQMKVSNNVSKRGIRRFSAPHDQMQRLRDRSGRSDRSIYYVFPEAGQTSEVCGPDCFVQCTQLLDVACFPRTIPLPTRSDGSLRKSRIHYIDVTAGRATVHSEPFTVSLSRASEIQLLPAFAADRTQIESDESFADFWRFTSGVPGQRMFGAVIFRAKNQS